MQEFVAYEVAVRREARRIGGRRWIMIAAEKVLLREVGNKVGGLGRLWRGAGRGMDLYWNVGRIHAHPCAIWS